MFRLLLAQPEPLFDTGDLPVIQKRDVGLPVGSRNQKGQGKECGIEIGVRWAVEQQRLAIRLGWSIGCLRLIGDETKQLRPSDHQWLRDVGGKARGRVNGHDGGRRGSNAQGEYAARPTL